VTNDRQLTVPKVILYTTNNMYRLPKFIYDVPTWTWRTETDIQCTEFVCTEKLCTESVLYWKWPTAILWTAIYWLESTAAQWQVHSDYLSSCTTAYLAINADRIPPTALPHW